MITLKLKDKAHRRVRNGHLWIFRDELAEPPALDAGTLVNVQTDYGYDLGNGFYHPTSQIAVRLLLSTDEMDQLFNDRLRRAVFGSSGIIESYLRA